MKDLIQQILERELLKLDRKSSDEQNPLGPRDVKSLDVLIRAYRSFVDPANKPAAEADDPVSAAPTTETLVSDLLNGESAD